MRLYLPGDLARLWLKLPPKIRARAASAVFGAAVMSIDLRDLLAAQQALHRVGTNLNQALVFAYQHGTALDASRVSAALDVIESLRGGSK